MKNKNLKVRMQSAIKNLSAACNDLQACDAMICTDDFKYYVSKIKELLSCDNNEAGLIPFSRYICSLRTGDAKKI